MDVPPIELEAVAAAGAPAHARQFLRFTVAGDHCAVRIDAVREILEVAQLTPLPLVPAFVSGVMNLRGSVVPVLDLGARLGLPGIALGRRSCIVVVDVLPAAAGDDDAEADAAIGPQTLGLLVDAVQEVFDTRAEDAESVPRLGTRIAPDFLRQMVRSRGQATPELDLGAILDVRVLAELIGTHAASA
jgi:purine-binding chemotaxis protein CheW